MLIAAKREYRPIDEIHGLVLRSHHSMVGQFLAARALFIRVGDESESTFQAECQGIGVVRENSIQDMTQYRPLLINDTVEYGGKTTLRLQPRPDAPEN